MSDRSLWRHHDFVKLWAGQSVSRIGSEVSRLAIPLVAIDLLRATTLEVGALAAMETVPFLLVGLPAGAWVDRMRRRRVLIVADCGRCAALGAIPVAWWLNALTLAQLFAVAFITGVFTVFFDVAYQSYLPGLVDLGQLVEANAKLSATDSGAQVAGPGVGAVLIHAVGAAPAVVADALSYLVSAVSLALIRQPEPAPAPDPRPDLRREIADGLRFVFSEPHIRSIAAATATSNLFLAMNFAVLIVFLRRPLGMGPGTIGLVFAVAALGALAGSGLARPLARWIGVGRAIVASIAVAGAAMLLYPLATRNDPLPALFAGGAVSGCAGVIYNINQVSLRQALCPPHLLGRMNATVRVVIWGTVSIGGFLGGAIGGLAGLRTTLWIAGIGSSTAFLWVLRPAVLSVREIPHPSPEPAGT